MLPFVCVILVIVGMSAALKFNRGGAPLALSSGVAVCFLYMFFLGLSRSLGLSGILPPILSAWMANAMFLFGGIYLMMQIER